MTPKAYKYEVWINVYRFIPGIQNAGKGGKSYIKVLNYEEAESMLEGLRMMAKLQGWTRNEAYPSTIYGGGCIMDKYNEGSFTALERSIAIKHKEGQLNLNRKAKMNA